MVILSVDGYSSKTIGRISISDEYMDNQTPNPQKKAEQKIARLTAWLGKYEIPLFFILAFAFTWIIYLCLDRMYISNSTVLGRWTLIAAFGPSVAAMLTARLTDPMRENPRVIQQVILFTLAFAVAFGVEWLDNKWWYHPINTPLMIADVILAFLAAFVISGVFSVRRGVKNLLQGLTRWRLGAGWYIVALGLWPVLVVSANALAPIFGLGAPSSPYHPTRMPLISLMIKSFFWFLLFGGPLNEEVGWRAFGLSKLQRRFSPLIASVIVGTLWGLWHVPLHLMGLAPMGPEGAIIRIFEIPRALVFTWLFNRTRQSLLPVLILHAAINTTSLFLSRNYIISSSSFYSWQSFSCLPTKCGFLLQKWRIQLQLPNNQQADFFRSFEDIRPCLYPVRVGKTGSPGCNDFILFAVGMCTSRFTDFYIIVIL